MGNRCDIRQQIVMRRLTIPRACCGIGSERSGSRWLPALASGNDSYVGAAACVNTLWKPGGLSAASAAHRAVLCYKACCSYCDAARPNAAAIACLFTCAMQHLQRTVTYRTLHAPALTLSAGAPYRQAPSADESPSPSILVDAAPPPRAQCAAVNIAHD
ncbi:hypothetical protein KCP75_03040 [Salmonella enterica subsp. enterica]|nr:hypothetical protein KCP75_03040 [Salmonella enterica subsp. enterica]